MARIRTFGVAALCLATVGLLGACSDSDGGAAGSGGTSAAAGTPAVVIKGSRFTVTGTATHGVPFTVVNEDAVTHTATNVDGLFDTTLKPGASTEITIANPGIYKIICRIHTGMSTNITIV